MRGLMRTKALRDLHRKSSRKGSSRNSIRSRRNAKPARPTFAASSTRVAVGEKRYDDGGSRRQSRATAAQRLLTDIRGPDRYRGRVTRSSRLPLARRFLPLVELFRRTGCVVRFGDAAIQHDELDGAAYAQRCCCPLPSSSGRFTANASATRLQPRRRRACGWAAMCRWAMTQASAPRHQPAEAETVRASSLSIVSSAACAGSRRRPTVSGFGRNAARQRMARARRQTLLARSSSHTALEPIYSTGT